MNRIRRPETDRERGERERKKLGHKKLYFNRIIV